MKIANPYQNPNDAQKNWVGRLQKLTQKNWKCLPEYEFSPSAEDKLFDCCVKVEGKGEAWGQGTSKQKAKNMAAYILYQKLEQDLQN